MIAWAGVGRRATGSCAPRRSTSTGCARVGTIAAPAAATRCSRALAPGPDGATLALWSEPQRDARGRRPTCTARRCLRRAASTPSPGRTSFGPPEALAPPGAGSRMPAVAFDPGSDRALAVWRGGRARLLMSRFAVRRRRRRPPAGSRARRERAPLGKDARAMDRDYELQTHQAEDRHWWYRGRRTVLERRDRTASGCRRRARILDAGCGSGRNMIELARHGTVTGVELVARRASLSRASAAAAR